ncbi:hypothetical protein F4808DRAFT_421807 [Astrocystis sublimbata]|nr:hypothetical protein F4808DRAFT_421807 [Astrocystis sublimbata]
MKTDALKVAIFKRCIATAYRRVPNEPGSTPTSEADRVEIEQYLRSPTSHQSSGLDGPEWACMGAYLSYRQEMVHVGKLAKKHLEPAELQLAAAFWGMDADRLAYVDDLLHRRGNGEKLSAHEKANVYMYLNAPTRAKDLTVDESIHMEQCLKRLADLEQIGFEHQVCMLRYANVLMHREEVDPIDYAIMDRAFACLKLAEPMGAEDSEIVVRLFRCLIEHEPLNARDCECQAELIRELEEDPGKMPTTSSYVPDSTLDAGHIKNLTKWQKRGRHSARQVDHWTSMGFDLADPIPELSLAERSVVKGRNAEDRDWEAAQDRLNLHREVAVYHLCRLLNCSPARAALVLRQIDE